MKIDLHCHTKKVKRGDPATRNVTVELFAEKIQNSDVRIVAITNHNVFDKDQYILFREAVKDYCDVWPGIELDVYGDYMKKGKPQIFHMIVVANPACADKFKDKIDSFLGGFDVNKDSKSIRDVCKAFKQLDVLYIPHYLGKTPAISNDDLELLKSLVPDSTRVFTETTESSIGVLVNNDYRALVGSDVRDWNLYEESMFSDLRLPVSSFEQFCLLAKRDNVVIDSILNKKKSYMYLAHPHSSVSFQLKIFEDINIIFGQKGTGKSEILKSLADEMHTAGIKCKRYSGSQKEDEFKQLLSTAGMNPDCDLMEAETCEEEFKSIEEWKDSNITLFSQYLKWYETREKSANKKAMKITEAKKIASVGDDALEVTKKDRKLLNEALKKIGQIDLERYIGAKNTVKIEELLQSLESIIYVEVLKAYAVVKAVELTNYSIEKIKELADKKTDTVSKPSSTGFLEFAQVRLNLKKSTFKIMKELTASPFCQDDELGTLEGKGNVAIRSQYRMLCPDSRKNEFRIGINTLKSIKGMIEKISDEYYRADILTQVEEVNELLATNKISSIECFIGKSKYIVDEDGAPYEPSTGEKGILLLQKVIKEEADAYFFDEPELGMGNSYIDATIRPQISDLAKRHKIVVVATHNANLAVRTLPYMSIFRKYENGNYYTYIGNPFRNELVNIENDKDTLNWTVESMHTLEGGREAFYERKDIYESGED